ncbi:pyridoxamine 5'-phosphate oxidase [Synechococcus sp. GFB01]|uniref:pyridoxamine 5'-phosphate oxidase n=1 Tax=Synechococcus sp. GFB01 TaxID=1662190 RepID=UPI00351027A1
MRTLVFRGWGGPVALDLLTDGRSAKAAELRAQPALELCWLLPRARCQLRLRGMVVDLPCEQKRAERQRHWLALTPEGRALWGWPPPGEPLEASVPFPAALPPESPMPEAFVLLRIALAQVELLELGGQPHRRRRWRAASAWREEPLNP